MLCCVMSCRVMPCHAVSCRVMPCHAVPCRAVRLCVLLFCDVAINFIFVAHSYRFHIWCTNVYVLLYFLPVGCLKKVYKVNQA